MRILIATDAFPPVCGGSGWSTYELARGLRQRGHGIVVVQPYSERAPKPAGYDGFNVIAVPAFAPPVPFIRNYVRNERLYGRLAVILQGVVRNERIDLIHAQHVLTGPGAVDAARAAGVPSICTVRDFWPACYWGDLIRSNGSDGLCPGCSVLNMTRCVRPHAGAGWPLALPAIPYMRANLRRKQRGLGAADAVVAVSRWMAEDLRRRVPALAGTRLEAIPNAADIGRVRATVEGTARPIEGPYAVFAGKLARNKGARALVDVARLARLKIPLVVIGDGPERGFLEQAAAAGVADIRLQGWLDRDAVFRWLGHAAFMVFPSGWHEPLSRVLIEASALGVPTAAMDTGGTSDILVHNETGLLSRSVEALAADVARLADDADLRARLGAATAKHAALHFDLPVVIDRMERLYHDVMATHRRGTGHGVA
jgi:glycosyltransferase involved in cell wall biosynthesis